MTRAENAAAAARLRAQGLLQREIAERMGAARSTVHDWLKDPDGSKLKARKDGYRGRCAECGAQTDGSNGAARAPTLCQACHEWTADDCLRAIDRWVAEHDRAPTCTEWHSAGADHPSSNTVIHRCGGWNAALLGAGLTLRMDRRPETQAWVEAQVRAGVPTAEIAAALDVTPGAIYQRMHVRGRRVSELRAGEGVAP